MTKLSQDLRAKLRERLDDPNVSIEEIQELMPLAAPISAGEPGALIDDESAEAEPPPTPAAGGEITDERLQRLVGAVAHAVRNPLTTIRTFAELLPDQYQDGEFRAQFAELVRHGVEQIEEVVQKLARLAELAAPETGPVDIAGLLEELLEQRRETIHQRRLLVLKELDKSRPLALGDEEQLRFAFETMLDRCLEIVPERGDVYFASRHHDAGLRGLPSVRVLVRFHGPEGEPAAAQGSGFPRAENALELVVAETVIRAQNGALAVQSGEGDETVLVLDLPAPP